MKLLVKMKYIFYIFKKNDLKPKLKMIHFYHHSRRI